MKIVFFSKFAFMFLLVHSCWDTFYFKNIKVHSNKPLDRLVYPSGQCNITALTGGTARLLRLHNTLPYISDVHYISESHKSSFFDIRI